MRRIAIRFTLPLALLGLALGACGPDKPERGLAPSGEVAAPESKKEMGMTGAERQAQVAQEMDKKEDEQFDAAQKAEEAAKAEAAAKADQQKAPEEK